MLPSPLCAVLVVGVVLALGYLALCGKCETLGREIKNSERELGKIQRARMEEEYKWNRLHDERLVKKALKEHDISMDYPDHRRVHSIAMIDCPKLIAPIGPTTEFLEHTTLLSATMKVK